MSTDRKTWRTWDEVADVFDGPADLDWEEDQGQIDQTVHDPWDEDR